MATEQPSPPVAADSARSRAWATPLAGGAGVIALMVLALADGGHADRALWAAGATALFTAVVTLGVLRDARESARAAAEPFTPPSAPPDADAAAWQAALEALPDPVFVISGPGPGASRRIVFANAAARATFQVRRDGALLVRVVRDPQVLEIVDEALFGRIAASAAFETTGAQERFWRAWSRPLPHAPGAPALAVLALRDETDARRMESMRADFLANASHELRTPLASLVGFIETLKGHARDDAGARDRFLEIMSVQAERMRRLIGDLLALSRIELNEHVPPSGEVDLALTTADVVDSLAPLAAERGVRLKTELPDAGAACICGDRDQIFQVAQNLIDNAIKYASSGGCVSIRVSAASDGRSAGLGRTARWARMALLTPDPAENTNYAVLSVQDDGPGVERQHLRRLAERFYRVEGQKSSERSGTGLGLAIVKHIANRHRGGLAVESEPGEGAIFSAWFPQTEPNTRPLAPLQMFASGADVDARREPPASAEETLEAAAPAPEPRRNKTVVQAS